jgi:peptidoglycan hydrolase CwlO-like protein
MNKSLFVVTVAVAVIALAMLISTVVTSDVLADSKKDRANEVLDKYIEIGGEHGDKARENKSKLIGGGGGGGDYPRP